MSDEAACSAKDNPSTTRGRVVLIISLPRELRARRAVAGAVANIEEALQCAEGDFAVRRFLHESGHAVFDILKVPVLGREEDAADSFSAYIMLQLGKEEARRIILGSAYQYKAGVLNREVPPTKFADEHGLPAQRFYNVLCLAYGADQKLFNDVVEKGYLPKKRAEGCDAEYEETAFAFKTLIGPYIDKELAKKVLATWIREVSAPPKHLPKQ